MDSTDDIKKLNKKIERMVDEKVFTDEEIEHLKEAGLISQGTNEKDLQKNNLKFLLEIKELLIVSIVGTYLLIFYFEKRINPDFIRDILYLFLLKIGAGVTARHDKKFLSEKVEEPGPYSGKGIGDSEIDNKISADITKSMLFLIIPGVLILYFYSAGKNDNFIYSSGLFFIYFVFSLAIMSGLWSIFGTGKRSKLVKRCEIEDMDMCFVTRDIKPIIGNINPTSCDECGFKTDKRVIAILKNIKNANGLDELYGLGGDCGLLALAIQKILGKGYLVAVGDEGRADGYMQHAGLLYRGMILDVNGLNNKDSWIDRWNDDQSAEFMDELTEHDIFKGTCPRNTQENYIKDLSKEMGLLRYTKLLLTKTEPKAQDKRLQ